MPDVPAVTRKVTVMPETANLTGTVRQQERALLDELESRRITASSPGGVVTVTCTADFDIDEVRCLPGAPGKRSAEQMSYHFTTAMRAVDRAVLALRQHSFNRVRIGDDTVGGWRQNPETGSDTVAACFGSLPGTG